MNKAMIMAKGSFTGPLEKVDACCYRIPKLSRLDMRVDGLIFASEKMIETLRHHQGGQQVANVATLPGIQMASLAMPISMGAMASASAALRD